MAKVSVKLTLHHKDYSLIICPIKIRAWFVATVDTGVQVEQLLTMHVSVTVTTFALVCNILGFHMEVPDHSIHTCT